VTPLRSRLDADIIGICQVLRSWLRGGVIDDLAELFLPVEKSTGVGPDETSWVAVGCEDKEMEERGWESLGLAWMSTTSTSGHSTQFDSQLINSTRDYD
jgi:hypothetical protein